MKKIKILIIDNYDSFTFNLVQYFGRIEGVAITVFRNDEISLEDLNKIDFAALVISPGPKTPKDANISNQAIEYFYDKKPILGICLGMQCINEIFNGETIKSDYPMHGKKSEMKHNHKSIFKEIPNNICVARYHSLIIEVKNPSLEITASLVDGKPMAIKHKKFPIFGLQFHPESFMTEYGNKMIENFIAIVKKEI